MCPVPAVLYLFYPHGSKNISDLQPLVAETDPFFDFPIIAHDQEPLNYDFYKNINLSNFINRPNVFQ